MNGVLIWTTFRDVPFVLYELEEFDEYETVDSTYSELRGRSPARNASGIHIQQGRWADEQKESYVAFTPESVLAVGVDLGAGEKP